MIVTQYESVAEIEAMKVRRQQQRSRAGEGAARDTGAWSSAHEREIRAEMERRLARRRVASPRS